ncbi:signal transduction histidine kinase [Pedobacter cryoconitis]|uniref:sensor histidine kinase n=1 Tax=Pedobacter cryoconitis TaxID=188932 RepID=UPI0016077D17|nr:ATP-binding protein [Pedobacter cryoconitis]MBB6271566.1 signal transduction histidine kinase [Pedobacter cryoconitis]
MKPDTRNQLQHIYSRRTVQLLILVIFVAVLINGIFFFHLIKQNKDSLIKREQNEKAMLLIRRILGNMKDADLGERGYILTGRKKYMLPYTRAIDVVNENQQKLTTHIKRNFTTANIDDINLLNKAIAAKRAELERTIQLKIQHKDEEVIEEINSDIGENQMNKIREVSNAMLGDYYENIKTEDQKVAKTLTRTKISLLFFSSIVIVVIAIMNYKLMKRQKRITDLFDVLEQQNSRLIIHQQELRTLSENFSARNSELEHFTHIISHDLRGPLNNILALTRILEDQEDSKVNDPAFKMLKNVSTGLFHKLDDLIILLKERKNGLLLKETVIFSELLEEVQTNHRIQIENSGTFIEADFSESDEVPFVKIYMQSILQNLITNAIKYRDPERKNHIRLKTSKKENTVQLTIADNGKGIDMDKYGSEIFGLFKTFHTEQDSHGIGLYLVKKQTLEMGGDITIQSETGVGTTFTIVIPTRSV